MTQHDRHVLVRAEALNDLFDLVNRKLEQLRTIEPRDPLSDAIRGALAEVRVHSLLEPEWAEPPRVAR